VSVLELLRQIRTDREKIEYRDYSRKLQIAAISASCTSRPNFEK